MNPEDGFPDRQSWARANEGGSKPAEFGTFTTPLIRKNDAVGAVGTMLAARLLLLMRNHKFPVIRPDPPHPAFAEIPPEADEYLSFSAGCGEIVSPRALRQLVRRADRSFVPEDDRRYLDETVVDVFRPNLRYPARSDREFDVLADRHLNAVRSAFRRCSALIVALETTEVCETIVDGAAVPIRPGDETRGFDPERHVYRTLGATETIADLNNAIDGLRALNPGLAIILMISPEPPLATAAPAHVIAANAYGKAVLRAAMEEVTWRSGVSYFPALEIAGTLGSAGFGADGRTLATKAVNLIGAALVEACEGGAFTMTAAERPQPADYEPAEEDAATPVEPLPASLDSDVEAFFTTPEERQASRVAARAAEVAARAAARAAARGGTTAPPPPPPQEPPPPPAKRVVATVVDAYTGTVPQGKVRKAEQRKAKREASNPSPVVSPTSVAATPAARERKPREESPEARERRERRAAREAKRADRRKPKPDPTTTDEPGAVSPAKAAASGSERGRGQRKPRTAKHSTDAAASAGAPARKARVKKRARGAPAKALEGASPRKPRRAKISTDGSAEKPAE